MVCWTVWTNIHGPLFTDSIFKPISMQHFRTVFNQLLPFCDLSPSRYKLHSFRIGACTQATILGIPENEIKLMGRWKFDAFHRNISFPTFLQLNYNCYSFVGTLGCVLHITLLTDCIEHLPIIVCETIIASSQFLLA